MEGGVKRGCRGSCAAICEWPRIYEGVLPAFVYSGCFVDGNESSRPQMAANKRKGTDGFRVFVRLSRYQFILNQERDKFLPHMSSGIFLDFQTGYQGIVCFTNFILPFFFQDIQPNPA